MFTTMYEIAANTVELLNLTASVLPQVAGYYTANSPTNGELFHML